MSSLWVCLVFSLLIPMSHSGIIVDKLSYCINKSYHFKMATVSLASPLTPLADPLMNSPTGISIRSFCTHRVGNLLVSNQCVLFMLQNPLLIRRSMQACCPLIVCLHCSEEAHQTTVALLQAELTKTGRVVNNLGE